MKEETFVVFLNIFWTLFNFRWYSYAKRVADIEASKELSEKENTYEKIIYETLSLSLPVKKAIKTKNILLNSEIIAIQQTSMNDTKIYTNKGMKVFSGNNAPIINKIKMMGGVQLSEKTWVKPEAVIEMKPQKKGYGIVLSGGQVMPIVDSKIKLPNFNKLKMENTLNERQNQRV